MEKDWQVVNAPMSRQQTEPDDAPTLPSIPAERFWNEHETLFPMEQALQESQQRFRQQQNELIMLYSQLKWLDEMKTRFAHDVSHELRTPLTNLMLYLDLLQQGNAEKRPHYITVLQDQTRRLLYTVERILNLINLSTAFHEIHFEWLPINELVRQSVAKIQPQASQKGLNLTCVLDEADSLVWGQGNQLRLALYYVLENAVLYTEQGSVTCRVLNTDEKINIIVQDSGRGVAATDMPYLFDSFFRGQDVSHIPGIGLGLTIAQETLRFHGGYIEAESQPGQGSTFHLWLPEGKDILLKPRTGFTQIPDWEKGIFQRNGKMENDTPVKQEETLT